MPPHYYYYSLYVSMCKLYTSIRKVWIVGTCVHYNNIIAVCLAWFVVQL